MMRLPSIILVTVWALSSKKGCAFVIPTSNKVTTTKSSFSRVLSCSATVVPDSSEEVSTTSPSSSSSLSDNDELLQSIASSRQSAKQWAEMFGFDNDDEQSENSPSSESAFYALFAGMKKSTTLGLKGQPFHLKQADVSRALGCSQKEEGPFAGFFTKQDLNKAVNDDFLNADRGSTDNRKGWKIAAVSEPKGNSFEEARMTMEEVDLALEKGTVIFNSAGAHIPKLAGANLAITDASSLPCAVNLYVTAPGKRTSAPPHTDKQDVVVVQTLGKKHWRVYSPPDPAMKPHVDMFARGKGTDNLPFHALETDFGCKLLLETTLEAGDVLFVPAAFPHTTDTSETTSTEDTSIHLTFGLDTHIWDLDYLSLRRFALRRACVKDTALGQMKEEENRYVGAVNELNDSLRKDLFSALPQGLLEEDSDELLEEVISKVKEISTAVDEETASKVDDAVWRETAMKVRQQGRELLEIHQDMFSAAVEEGRTREAEDAMTAHLDDSNQRKTLSPERMQRLSLFRVPKYFEKIDVSMQSLRDWSWAGESSSSSSSSTKTALPENWAFTLPVKQGDQVEADLGGAFFPAKVTKVLGGGATFEVEFFDGDRETGLDRSMIKLLTPPAAEDEDEEEPVGMTKKELKRWRKEQEKKKKKNQN